MSHFSKQKLRHELRLEFINKRDALSHKEQEQASQAVVDLSISQQVFHPCKHVAIYQHTRGELRTTALINYLWKQNIEVYLPVLHPFCKGYLLFLRYDANTPMVLNKYNIQEPTLNVTKVKPIQDLDIILLPLVAFDTQGHRLGMGGGYYDRTLAQIKRCSLSQGPKVVGLAHDCQLSKHIPHEPWDIALEQVLTPSKIYSNMLQQHV